MECAAVAVCDDQPADDDALVALRAKLSPKHLHELMVGSGLRPETILRARIKTATNPVGIAERLNKSALIQEVADLGDCIAFPFLDAAGECDGYIRFKPDSPRTNKNGDGVTKYESPVGSTNRAYIPLDTYSVLGNPSVPLIITEGEKKSLAADQLGFPTIGLLGVDAWSIARKKDKKTGRKLGKRKLIPDLAAVAWSGRKVYVVYDSDAATNPNVHRAEASLAEALQAQGAKVYVARLPADGESKVGLDDYLLTHGRDDLQALLDAAENTALASTGTQHRVKVYVGPNEHEVNDLAVTALAKDQSLFQRGGELVRVLNATGSTTQRIDHAAGPTIRTASTATLREKLSAVVHFRKVINGAEDRAEVDDHPPAWCVLAVKDRGEYPGVRHLRGVTEFPVLRPDGTVATSPGYDPDTEVFVGDYGPALDLPTRPTQDAARDAANELLNVVSDFPFATDAHRSAWLASVLTPLARFAFSGPAPLFFIEANAPGTGKGLLADCASLIVTGTRFAVAQYSHDSAEMRKCITAAAIAGDRLILLDNISGTFGNEALDAALTSTTWKGRVLGESKEVSVPLLATWYATGNNATLAGDVSRRILHILLRSPLESPEDRSDFDQPDLRNWIADNRPRLLTAALTILSGYLRCQQPLRGLTAFGSFEGWNKVVRAAVIWAGQHDPAVTRAALREQGDTERAAMRCILEHWPLIDREGNGLTVGEFVDEIQSQGRVKELAEVRDAVQSLVSDCDTRKVGAKFKKWKDRLIGKVALRQEGMQDGYRRWKVN